MKVTVRGLDAGEAYTIRVGRTKIAGHARKAGPVVRRVRLPGRPGRVVVRVTGDQPDRTGRTKIGVARR